MTPITGNIYLADLPMDGNQQGGRRPVIVTQNKKGNEYGERVHVVPLSKRINKASHLPTHVVIKPTKENGLRYISVALAENLQSVQKSRLLTCIGHVEDDNYDKVAEAIKIHLAI